MPAERHEWNNSRREIIAPDSFGTRTRTARRRSRRLRSFLNRFNIVRTKIDNPLIYVSRLREVSMES